jgi:uncharacterized membrane protein YphA (DoxX/SURF4 family)
MNRWAVILFVLLRVAVGWHFLVEGLDKLSHKSWTSAPYLREATGPLAEQFRNVAGDPVLDKMTVLPPPAGQDPTRTAPHHRLAPALVREWDDYFDAFAAHYQLDDDERRQARTKLLQREDQTALFLMQKKQTVVVPAPGDGPGVEREWTVQQRVEDYRAKLQLAQSLAEQIKMFGKGAEANLAAAKATARKAGGELQQQLDAETRAMKDALKSVLTPEQLKKKGDVPEPIRPPLAHWTPLQWADAVVEWGLILCGLGLILGLFTRTACIGGAALLLMFFLSMPPFPGVPDNPKAEGHYLFINKNVIEMLALLMLATTHSGRWVGLDGLLHALNPFRRRSVAPAVAPTPESEAANTPVSSPHAG